MHKTQSRHASLVDTVRECSSSPCWMNEVDPGYFGYWSREEVVAFLELLLERERSGSKAFADIGRAADLRIADLVLMRVSGGRGPKGISTLARPIRVAREFELDQGSICVLLRKEIANRRTTPAVPRRPQTVERRAKIGLEQAVAAANANQTELAQMIEEAVVKILDPELNSHLMKMLQLHWKQIEQLTTLLA